MTGSGTNRSCRPEKDNDFQYRDINHRRTPTSSPIFIGFDHEHGRGRTVWTGPRKQNKCYKRFPILSVTVCVKNRKRSEALQPSSHRQQLCKKTILPSPAQSATPKVTDNPWPGISRKYAIHAGMTGGETRPGKPFDWLCREISATKADTPSMAYIHIPFCTNRCHFCGFYSESSIPSVMSDYTRALVNEIEISGRLLRQAGCQLQAVYLGGGTPTDLDAADLSSLLRSIHSELPLGRDCELTVEGRLFGFDDDKISAALDGGANRFPSEFRPSIPKSVAASGADWPAKRSSRDLTASPIWAQSTKLPLSSI